MFGAKVHLTELEKSPGEFDAEAMALYAQPNEVWLDAATMVYIKNKDQTFSIKKDDVNRMRRRLSKGTSFGPFESQDSLKESLNQLV